MNLRLRRSVSSASWLVVDDDDHSMMQKLFGKRVVFKGTQSDCADYIERQQEEQK
jgi:hypothetical protein